MDNHNPKIHTSKDTIEFVNIPHAMEFAKLALGFVVELSSA